MNRRKIGSKILFPHAAVLLAMPIISVGAMLYTMRRLGDKHPITVIAYVSAFYALIIWCARIPKMFRYIRNFKNENAYVQIWLNNPRLRMNVILGGNLLWNGAYGLLQLGLGIYHQSAWFYALAAYYASLGAMRFSLVRYTLYHNPGEEIRREWMRYRSCGRILLVMNLALSVMMFYMIHENRATRHHEITAIAMATYTFFSLTRSIISVFRHRKYKSPAMSASGAVALAAACVSMLTLENTMLITFAREGMTAKIRQCLLACSGGAISAFIVVMAIYMLVSAKRKLKFTEN